MKEYKLIDSGDGYKIEAFGEHVLVRPCPIAVWPLEKDIKGLPTFSRGEDMQWFNIKELPESWIIKVKDIVCKIKPTSFGHVGLFYEHSALWDKHSSVYLNIKDRKPRILNLFAYTGVGSVKMAKDGCFVTHVDASKGSIKWAVDNLRINDLHDKSIRWIHDDVIKFLKREVKRGVKYDGIILDPPSFGRGANKEVFKIEKDLWELITLCYNCIDPDSDNAFISLASHSEGFSSSVLEQILRRVVKDGQFESGDLNIDADESSFINAGFFSIWRKN